jgi:hypothetical protein
MQSPGACSHPGHAVTRLAGMLSERIAARALLIEKAHTPAEKRARATFL